MSVFRSAISSTGDVDPGYLALYWTMAFTVSAIPFVLLAGAIALLNSASVDRGPIIQSTGIAIGAICTGCGVVIGAVGAFRAGDKPRSQGN